MSDKENALKHLEKSEINWNLYRVPKIIEFSKSNKVNFHTNKIGGFIIHNKALAKFMLDNIDKEIYHNNSIFIWS